MNCECAIAELLVDLLGDRAGLQAADDVLGAVAVVQVEVEDHDALVFAEVVLAVRGTDRDVVKEAEPVGGVIFVQDLGAHDFAIDTDVVAWRAYEAECDISRAFVEFVDCFYDGIGGFQCGFEAHLSLIHI